MHSEDLVVEIAVKLLEHVVGSWGFNLALTGSSKLHRGISFRVRRLGLYDAMKK